MRAEHRNIIFRTIPIYHQLNLTETEVPDPIDDDTECEDGKANLVPYGDGICMELVEEPKKDEEDAARQDQKKTFLRESA